MPFPLLELEETVESESQLLLLSMQAICKELMQKMAEQLQKAQADQQQKADREFVAAQKQMLLQMVAQLMEANKQVVNKKANHLSIAYTYFM